ncbi:MAG: D-alanyl-D-alanine carboxypeptidase [Candidatus Obscuribacterales bacterium]|nr:D-alanyl-D-alanine carboxypeptidase [Candidatus Obscuribacterales bacterium]
MQQGFGLGGKLLNGGKGARSCISFLSFANAMICMFVMLLPGFAAVEAQTQELPPNLKPIEEVANNWLKRPELQHSLVGLEILHIPSNQVLFSFNGRKRFVPASTTKVYSTACAMDTLGANYTFSTKLKAYGKIEGSRLNGSLYIEPSQDPTLKTADLRALLSVLQEKGIKTIEGKVDVIGIPGGGDRFCSEWLLEDWGQDWMPVPSDLVLDGNIARKDPARGYPLISYTVSKDQNALTSSLLNSAQGPAWVCFHPGSKTMQFWHPNGPLVGGQIVGNPGEYNLAAVQSIIKSMGIKIKDKTIPLDVLSETPTLLGEHHSRPLSEIIKYCLKESDNLYAQQLLRTLGNLPAVSKNVEKATLEERGLARINQWLLAMGVAPGEVFLWDGCGLSRKNCFTPHALNLVHRHMAGATLKSAYLDVMPLNGDENTPNGSFRYKTGTMDSVRSISGVLITGGGEALAVTVMVNDHSPSIRDVRASMSGMLSHLQSLGALHLPESPVRPIVLSGRKSRASVAAHPKQKASQNQSVSSRKKRRRAH